MKIYFTISIYEKLNLYEDYINSFTSTSGNSVLILCFEKLKNDIENPERLEGILKFFSILPL